MRNLLIFGMVVMLSACAPFMAARLEKLDNTMRAYERALRWSDFRKALTITGNPANASIESSRFQNIRVTSYDIVGSPEGDEKKLKFSQSVEIHYVHASNMSERVFVDHQMWEYSEKDQRWTLTSPFPQFR